MYIGTDKSYVLNNIAGLNMDEMLFMFQFTEDELKTFIRDVSISRVLKTQTSISMDFINDYVLNPEYQVTDEEQYITIDDVYFYRPDLIDI